MATATMSAAALILGRANCVACYRSVYAEVIESPRIGYRPIGAVLIPAYRVVSGQRCKRCGTLLDAAAVTAPRN
jgi:hypothetical protein